MELTTCKVSGLSCGGCAAALRAAVAAVEGVIDVDVDATRGHLSVRSDRDVRLRIAIAIADAGYGLDEMRSGDGGTPTPGDGRGR